MARDREIACMFYECEGSCLKGHEGTFKDYCQTCSDYKRRKGHVNKKNIYKEKKMKWETDIKNYL